MKGKIVKAVLLLVGAYAIVAQGYTFYRDYQDFKKVRAWVVMEAAKQQRAAQQQNPIAAPAPVVPAPAPTATGK
jgi:hypothetical protein